MTGLTGINVTVINGVTFWCKNISFSTVHSYNNTIRLFPIIRMENYSDQTSQYVSYQTKCLMYTLGALYCAVGAATLSWLVSFSFSFFLSSMFLSFSSVSFMCLCVFFCFVLDISCCRQASEEELQTCSRLQSSCLAIDYFCDSLRLSCCFHVPLSNRFSFPSHSLILTLFSLSFFIGTFESQPLSDFIVFEIPTFLLFSAVMKAIHSWVSIAHFDIGNQGQSLYFNIFLVSFALVWSLWIIVTVVYAEVVLGTH